MWTKQENKRQSKKANCDSEKKERINQMNK